jgi:hypothetical protein
VLLKVKVKGLRNANTLLFGVQSNLFIRIPFHKDTSLLRMYLRVPYFYGEE